VEPCAEKAEVQPLRSPVGSTVEHDIDGNPVVGDAVEQEMQVPFVPARGRTEVDRAP
jgi:hypothetical protein